LEKHECFSLTFALALAAAPHLNFHWTYRVDTIRLGHYLRAHRDDINGAGDEDLGNRTSKRKKEIEFVRGERLQDELAYNA
jgi:hypothetical protein